MNVFHCLHQHAISPSFLILPYASSATVVLYNCGDLSGDDCSGCLGLSADYRCGYCQPNCILSSLTCGSSVIQAPNFQQCGAITVTEVSGAYTHTAVCCSIEDNCCVCVLWILKHLSDITARKPDGQGSQGLKSNRDLLMKEPLHRKTSEMAKGSKERWCHWELNPGLA